MSNHDTEPADLGYGDEAYQLATAEDLSEARKMNVYIPDHVSISVAASNR